MAADGHAWWIARVRRALEHCDVFRIDHFRGFAAYWEVPAAAPTAAQGRWVPGPGLALFDAIAQALGPVPIVAEDLGVITPDVIALRDACGFPGMRVLQFAFAGGVELRFLPHRHERNTVVYTGTHDNDTTRGWFAGASEVERGRLERYLGQPCTEATVSWQLLRLAWSSVADLAIAPAQDVLSLGRQARMNLPGAGDGNWRWRLRPGDFDAPLLERLGALTETYERGPPTAARVG